MTNVNEAQNLNIDNPQPPDGDWWGGILINEMRIACGDLNIDGKDEITVASTKRPALNDYWRPIVLFCPDNENIIFTCHNDGNDEIYMVDINGENLKNLTNNPNGDYLGIVVP